MARLPARSDAPDTPSHPHSGRRTPSTCPFDRRGPAGASWRVHTAKDGGIPAPPPKGLPRPCGQGGCPGRGRGGRCLSFEHEQLKDRPSYPPSPTRGGGQGGWGGQAGRTGVETRPGIPRLGPFWGCGYSSRLPHSAVWAVRSRQGRGGTAPVGRPPPLFSKAAIQPLPPPPCLWPRTPEPPGTPRPPQSCLSSPLLTRGQEG